MKAGGEKYKTLSGVFGYGKGSLKNMVGVGRIPGLERVPVGTFSYKDIRDYLLSLRIPLSGHREYDYSEVTEAIEKLTSGELSKEDLPSYSAERRLAIQQAQQDARLKEIAAQRLATWKEKFSGNRKKPGPQEGVKFCGRARAFVVAEGRIPYGE